MIQGKQCDNATQWDEAVHELGGHPLQLWGWGQLKSRHRWSAHRVIFVDDMDDRVVGAAQILSRTLPGPFKRLDYVPRGPVWREGSRDQILEELVSYTARHLPGTVLSIEPDAEDAIKLRGWHRSNNSILLANTLVLTLNQTETQLLDDMTKKTRQYIRKSEREGLRVRQVRSHADIAACLAIYHETASRAKFSLHSDQYYYDAHDNLGDSSVIFAAYDGETPVAFVWLALSAETAFELYGGVSEHGQELRANFMLKWHAIRTCRDWGVSRYDMNGLLNDGISTFKRGFASHENTLVGTYDYALSPLYGIWIAVVPPLRRIVQSIKTLLIRQH